MRDELDDRSWSREQARYSSDFRDQASNFDAPAERPSGDPLPIVARAMALVLAVSLTSISLGATIA